VQKFHTCTTQTLVALLIGCAEKEFSFNQSEALPRPGYCTSSVWNHWTHYAVVILRGLKWRPHETSAVFSGYEATNTVKHKIYFATVTSPPETSSSSCLSRNFTSNSNIVIIGNMEFKIIQHNISQLRHKVSTFTIKETTWALPVCLLYEWHFWTPSKQLQVWSSDPAMFLLHTKISTHNI